jgi:hypothetical protein
VAIGCVAGGVVGRSMGTGVIPGVLFLVIFLWRRGVFFNVRFYVGLRDCMIAGSSIIHGIVSVGVLSINLCSYLHAIASLSTLCSNKIGGGSKSA